MLTILFDGIAYGMLLFVLACGLSVTLGLMNFVNLAHGSFAMAGGYITLVLVNRAGLPFFAGLLIAFFITAPINALETNAIGKAAKNGQPELFTSTAQTYPPAIANAPWARLTKFINPSVTASPHASTNSSMP